MDPKMRPRLAAGLEISPTEDGYVVYQPDRDRLHYLNVSAAVLLEVCDGTLCADELPALLAGICGLPEPPTGDVESCLETMVGEGLLRDARPVPAAGRD